AIVSAAQAVCSWSTLPWTMKKVRAVVIQSVVFFESRVELVRIAADHRFVNQRAGAGLRLRAEEHTSDNRRCMRDAFVNHDLILEVFIVEPKGFAETLHQTGMGRLFNEEIDKLIVSRRIARVLHHTKGEPLVNGVVAEVVLQCETLQP